MNSAIKSSLSLAVLSIILLHAADARTATVSDLEDVVLPGNGVLNTASNPAADGFLSEGALYKWSLSFGLPVGFAASNISDTTDYSQTQPENHPYNSITGGGAGGSSQYAVATAFAPVEIVLPASPVSVAIANNTYAYYSMLNGDSFAKKFGGPDGTDPDFFVLTITGMQGANTIGAKQLYLADYRNLNNAPDDILDEWVMVDLTSLAGSNRLLFSLDSSDHFIFNNVDFGMNTPAYFTLDNLFVVPEPTAALLAFCGVASLLMGKRSGTRVAIKHEWADNGLARLRLLPANRPRHF